MDMDEREKRLRQRQAQRRKNVLIMRCIISLLILIVVFLAIVLIKDAAIPGMKKQAENRKKQQEAQADASGSISADQTESTEGGAEGNTEQQLLAAADKMAAQYDYDGAIQSLQSSSLYTNSQKLQDAVTGYQQVKATCTAYPLEQITHVFFHTMIWDTSKAFDGDAKEGGYNQVMTTMSEFEGIIESMYEKGYVMVSLHDMCKENEDGSVTRG